MASPDKTPEVPENHNVTPLFKGLPINVGTPDNTGGEPPGGDKMEKRVSRLEMAFGAVQSSLSRIEGRLDRTDDRHEKMIQSLGDMKASQSRIEERMERIMDKARDMPTETKINSMLNHKLTILGIVSSIIIGIAALAVAAA